MRIGLGRRAMRGPAGVSDAGVTGERLGIQSLLEIVEFARRAAPRWSPSSVATPAES